MPVHTESTQMNTEHFKVIRSATIKNALGDTPALRYDGTNMSLSFADPSSVRTLTFYGSTTEDGTYRVLKRRTNADTDFTNWEDVTMQIPAADAAYPITDECLNFPWLKIVCTGADHAVDIVQLGTGRTQDET